MVEVALNAVRKLALKIASYGIMHLVVAVAVAFAVTRDWRLALAVGVVEPFVQTIEALDSITPGQKVMLLIGREPLPLYRALELNGYSWQTERAADGTFEILMWHKQT